VGVRLRPIWATAAVAVRGGGFRGGVSAGCADVPAWTVGRGGRGRVAVRRHGGGVCRGRHGHQLHVPVGRDDVRQEFREGSA